MDDWTQEGATSLAGLAEYQEGSVVSRSLAKQTGGSVTLFAFDAGQGLSEHTAPFDALVHVIDGEALVTLAGEEHRVPCGAVLMMPAGVPHALKAEGHFKMLLVMLRA